VDENYYLIIKQQEGLAVDSIARDVVV